MTDELRNILLGAGVVLILLVASCALKAHGPYSDWKTRYGASCCNDQDCAPTTAWQDMEGNWFVRSAGATIPVPPHAVLPIPSPDGRSHACILGGQVICFVPGEVRG